MEAVADGIIFAIVTQLAILGWCVVGPPYVRLRCCVTDHKRHFDLWEKDSEGDSRKPTKVFASKRTRYCAYQ